MQRRGLFEKLFGKLRDPQNVTQVKMLGGYTPYFSLFNGNAYDSDIVRSAINAIATNAAKLKPRHIRRGNEGVTKAKSNLERLLQLSPNPYMSAFDFMYKVVTQLYVKNNAFIYIHTDGLGGILGFYPIPAGNLEILEIPTGEIYVRFSFVGGRQVTLPYADLLHLRRFYNDNDIWGESNYASLSPTLELIQTTNDGIVNAVKSSASLRGLIKVSSMLNAADIMKVRDTFVADYMDISNNGGIAAIDSKFDYIPIDSKPTMVNGPQMDLIRKQVYLYFNINESIVSGKYNEDEWSAFYESVIEPIAVQMSLEFTRKLFTEKELGFGNEIIFEANRLQYASTTTKINLINTLTPLGLLSQNEGREIMNMGAIEGGERRLISLNFVDADKANQYQLGEDNSKGGEADDNQGS